MCRNVTAKSVTNCTSTESYGPLFLLLAATARAVPSVAYSRMAVLADIAGLSLDDGDVVLRAGIETYQSVDPVAVSSAATFSALTESAGYGEYYSPPGLDEQSAPPSNDSEPVQPITRTACNPCKKNHTKCSGEQPICLQCQRRKIQCSYSPQKKRGPKTGQVRFFLIFFLFGFFCSALLFVCGGDLPGQAFIV